MAVDAEGKEKKSYHLTEGVRLTLMTADNNWTSKTVLAIVTPGLCTGILLGLPFLKHNKIVVDHDSDTAIVKGTNVDLLHPTSLLSACDKRTVSAQVAKRQRLKRKRLEVRNLWKDLMNELLWKTGFIRAQSLSTNNDIKLMEALVNASDLTLGNFIASVKAQIVEMSENGNYEQLNAELKEEFHQLFEQIPHVEELPNDVYCRVKLKEDVKPMKMRSYQCPRKYKAAWKTLIDMHLASGKIRPSSSEFASPSFIIPKADLTALPRWVNDYRWLNSNVVQDKYPLPRVEDILADCAKGSIWGIMDMTDSFFQTRVHPDDIHLTAVNTPFGLYEWTVMPMGFRNAPSIHQRRVNAALRKYIGVICHIYLDDIVIWSKTIAEHKKNCRKILKALIKAKLYCNKKKTMLFCPKTNFLGHTISKDGIVADEKKAEKILNWPVPKTASQVREFLGLVRYLSAFLP